MRRTPALTFGDGGRRPALPATGDSLSGAYRAGAAPPGRGRIRRRGALAGVRRLTPANNCLLASIIVTPANALNQRTPICSQAGAQARLKRDRTGGMNRAWAVRSGTNRVSRSTCFNWLTE